MASRNTKNQRPPFERWYSYLLFIFVGYCIADLTILSFRDKMLPQNAPPAHPKKSSMDMTPSRGAYNPITARNIFASNGQIPDALVDKSKGEQKEEDPVPSQLPLTLIGTLVHSNPEKSIAAIEVKGKNQVISYSPKKEIEGIATIIRIERQKVVIRNMNSNRLEFIEMKKDGKVAFGSARPAAAGGGSADVQRTGDNNFTIKRADVLKYTNDLSAVLMQARAVPNREPGTGNINGFRILDMQPGSIYEQLGLQRMDIIKSVDGTPVDSPAKAMELYNLLKNSPKVTLQVERNGKAENMTYNIQ